VYPILCRLIFVSLFPCAVRFVGLAVLLARFVRLELCIGCRSRSFLPRVCSFSCVLISVHTFSICAVQLGGLAVSLAACHPRSDGALALDTQYPRGQRAQKVASQVCSVAAVVHVLCRVVLQYATVCGGAGARVLHAILARAKS